MLLTVTQVAQQLQVNKNFVYDLINKGKLPYLQLGHIKVRQEALDEFLKSKEQVKV